VDLVVSVALGVLEEAAEAAIAGSVVSVGLVDLEAVVQAGSVASAALVVLLVVVQV
jgi:hypothetical protein